MSGHVCSRRFFLGGVALAPLVLAGCGGEQADAAAPPEITYGRDVCSRCGMIISEERYAAGLVAGDGTAALFDDLGEMLQSVREEGLQGRRAWVHDWTGREWIDATSAVYVRGEQETTPMASGMVAFAARQDAEGYAAAQGAPVLTWDEATAPQR